MIINYKSKFLMTTQPRGLRNNNPGNIRNSDATDWQGEIPASKKQDNSFEEFEDMAHGYRALIKLLQNYRNTDARRLQTSSADGHPEPRTTHQATFHAYARRCRYRQPTSRTWRTKRPCVPLRLPFLRSKMEFRL